MSPPTNQSANRNSTHISKGSAHRSEDTSRQHEGFTHVPKNHTHALPQMTLAEFTLPGAIEDEVEFDKTKHSKPQHLFQRDTQPLMDYQHRHRKERVIDNTDCVPLSGQSSRSSTSNASKTDKIVEEWYRLLWHGIDACKIIYGVLVIIITIRTYMYLVWMY